MDKNQQFYLSPEGKGDSNEDSKQPLDLSTRTSASSQLITRKRRRKNHICDICDASFFTKEHLITHHLKDHGVQKRICTTRGRAFALQEKLDSHVLTHSNQGLPGSSGISTSNKSFTEQSEFLRAPIEGKSYASNSEIPSKKKLKVPNSYRNIEEKFACDICNYRFRLKHDLFRHELTHTAIKQYGCNICDMRFSRKDKLFKHKLRHNGEKPCICSVCGKGFSNNSDLNDHLIAHNTGKSHVCHFCGETFSTNSQWKAHQSKHSKEEATVCKKCYVPYPKKTFEQHLRTHAEDQKHTCVTCGKVFTTINQLKTHFRQYTPLVCDVCKKTFSTEEHLLTHRVIHPK